MAKRKIDFTGPSIQDLGLEIDKNNNANNGIAEENITNTNNSNSEKGNSKNTIIKPEKTALPPLIKDINTDIGNTFSTVTTYDNTEKEVRTRNPNTVHFKLIRNYLNTALGNKERVEIKLSVMGQELGINPKTLYKHLKTLRETEFYITKLQYSTEIKRRSS